MKANPSVSICVNPWLKRTQHDVRKALDQAIHIGQSESYNRVAAVPMLGTLKSLVDNSVRFRSLRATPLRFYERSVENRDGL
jgi:hypothetical protein